MAVQAGPALNYDDIVETAQTMMGLTEIGEPDISEGLHVLIDALNNDGNLRPDGLEAQRMALTGVVANRLRIESVLSSHPEIREQQIQGPIVIIGLPRSGTTKLHRMLAAHPAIQSIPLYKLLNPAPLGPPTETGEDPRIAIAEHVSAGMRDNYPEFFAGHPMLPREPDEEVWMLDLVTRGWMPCYTTTVPSYAAWTERQDFRTWYAFLRTMLQMFQFLDGTPEKTWLIKAPEHMGYLDLLFETFPNATVVQTHRDPVTAIASIAVLTVASRRMYTDQPDPLEAGAFTLGHWSEQVRRACASRAELEGRHTFVDAPYRDIVADTLALIERICDAASLEVSDADRTAMLAWETNNPQHKHGQHRYDIGAVGLTDDQVRAAFSEYLERFGDLI